MMIPEKRAHLRVAAGSDAGRRGKNNEDQFTVLAFRLAPNSPTSALFALVADGIGGHQAGEVAAKIAVEMLSEAVARSDASQPGPIMQAAILQASAAIAAQAAEDESKKGMGTTVVCAWVIGDKLYTASVGNSRLYLLRGGLLRQLNWDHTWVQEAVDAGALTPELARKHPHANVIRRYLGSRQPVEVDFRLRGGEPGESEKQQVKNQGFPLQPGDRLLLCSDGLNDMLEDEQIQRLADQPDLNKAKSELIAAANAAGGKDNITVILLEMPGGSRQRNRERTQRQRLGCGVAALFGLLAALAFYFYGLPYFRPDRTPTPAPTLTATLPPAATVTTPPTLAPSQSPTASPTANTRATATPAPTNTPQSFFAPSGISPTP